MNGLSLFGKPKILLTMFCVGNTWGGTETHVLHRYKMLIKNGYQTDILLVEGSTFEARLKQENIPYITSSQQNFTQVLAHIAKTVKPDIAIVPMNQMRRVRAGLEGTAVKIIGTQHMHPSDEAESFLEYARGIDAVTGVSDHVVDFIKLINNQKKLGIKHIEKIEPFFDEDRCKRFVPEFETYRDYFVQKCGISNLYSPVICVVGNMYKNLIHKSYPLLFDAIHELVYKRKRPVTVVIAGTGQMFDTLKAMVNAVNLTEYIHFLGFWDDVPGLLYNSAFLVLASRVEACGQVVVEASLMGRPSVVSYGTGSEKILVHGHSGLLFENGNAIDLADKIEYLLNNPDRAVEIGKQARMYIEANLSNQKQFEKLDALITKIAYNKPSVLLTMSKAQQWSGMLSCTLSYYRALCERGYPVTIVTVEGGAFDDGLRKRGIDCIACAQEKFECAIRDVCLDKKIDLVLTPIHQVHHVQEATNGLKTKIIGIQHMPPTEVAEAFLKRACMCKRGIDAAIGVGDGVVDFLKDEIVKKRYAISVVELIPPFFDENKFTHYVPTTESNEVYFGEHWTPSLAQAPVLCSVGNMYANTKLKGYPVLFDALENVIIAKRRPLQLMIAGEGPSKVFLEKMVREKGLEPYVHFLGFWDDIPGLFTRSRCNILASELEAYGLVVLEAGLMKVPTIGARSTGAEMSIIDGQTGFLFDNADAGSLATKIEYVLDHPEECKQFGIAAQLRVERHFSNKIHCDKLEALIAKVLR